MKNHYFLILFTILCWNALSQNYRGVSDGRNYYLSRKSNTKYTLLTKELNGEIIKSELNVISTSSNQYKYSFYSTRSSRNEQKCNETVISGGGAPWEYVVLRWYDEPRIFLNTLTYVVDLVYFDGFSTGVVDLYEDNP